MRNRNTSKEALVKTKTIELIVKDGLEGFSINKLAKACGISVGTIYIYYKDRDDLILQIAIEEGKRMGDALVKDFDPDSSLEDGLRVQWKNRYQFMVDNPLLGPFFDQLRSSTYQGEFLASFLSDFKARVGAFMHNVINRGEMKPLPLEVYWSIAFAPLYSLIRFHNEGKSLAGKPFSMTDEILWQTFDLAVIALKI
jgi:TetR/AcrR family transcriptional repressor of multidrug resistance operon